MSSSGTHKLSQNLKKKIQKKKGSQICSIRIYQYYFSKVKKDDGGLVCLHSLALMTEFSKKPKGDNVVTGIGYTTLE